MFDFAQTVFVSGVIAFCGGAQTFFYESPELVLSMHSESRLNFRQGAKRKKEK
jgi:hypothetical protein